MVKDRPPPVDLVEINRLRKERAELALERAAATADPAEARDLRHYAALTLYSLGLDPLGEEIARNADLGARVMGALFLFNQRLSRTEIALGLDDAPCEALQGWTTVKGAAGKCGYSESCIRKWARQGRIGARWIGGRLFIDPESCRRPAPAPSVAVEAHDGGGG